MIKENKIELFDISLPKQLSDDIKLFQDKLKSGSNHQFESRYITKKQKDFIIKNNKIFYEEFQKACIENIELKNKLNEINSEKKRLKELIVKLEQKMKSLNNASFNEMNNNKTYFNNKFKNILTTYYEKRKRIRRKKTEIVNKYNCTFPNCDKSYPSNSSLNMHIKIKHQQINRCCFTNYNRK